MIWAEIAANGNTNLAFIENTMVSKPYKTVLEQVLENVLIPFAYFNYESVRNDLFLLQDNASVHRSNHSKEWFKEFDLDALKLPELSPDLHHI